MYKKNQKKIIVIAAIVIALFSGLFLFNTRDERRINRLINKMPLRDKLAQMMVPSFRYYKENEEAEEYPVSELTDYIKEYLSEDHYGSFTLYTENCSDPKKTLEFVYGIQQLNKESGGIPMIIGIDQEGGSIVRVNFGTIGVGNMALAATGNPDNARTMASIYGKELALLGINADYAPVMDINNNPSNPIIGVRSFSDDPQITAQFGKAFIEGLHQQGIISTAKHFPGHGNTDTDSHTGFPLISSTYEQLKDNELIPFKTAIDEGVDIIMTAHIQYPNIEKGTYTSTSTHEQIYLPATMSKVILTDILRGDLGFDGVIASDALDMDAIADNFAMKDVLKMTINSGVNMLLLPIVYEAKDLENNRAILDLAVKLAEEGEIDSEKINDSVRRILKLKLKYGLLDNIDFELNDVMIKEAETGIGNKESQDIARKIAEESVTLLKNENNAYPLNLKENEKTLIIFADTCISRIGYGELIKKELTDNKLIPEGSVIEIMPSNGSNNEECIEAAKEADHVILVYRMYSVSCLDPETDDGWSLECFDKIIDAVHEQNKTVILMTCQLPYDIARFTAADALLVTYNASILRTLPESSYAPNLEAALYSCFGLAEAGGHLPVNIPYVEGTRITDKILYQRGFSLLNIQE
ncbi:MAG: hypothetical protein IK151_07325 [Erysipelotrichaceae bacterium]|nr:hypothetical protein [Erysipelotrichaceae bacterium]